MALLPSHSWKIVFGIFGGVLLARLALGQFVTDPPGDIDSFRSAQLPYAEVVKVDPGASYFFTWGVTAGPRMREIARTRPEGDEPRDDEDRYGDTYEQSMAVLGQLRADLDEVGLTLRDVVHVRAYIVADPEPDFDGWNRAFSQFFGTATNPHKPARTTVGITRLFHSAYRVEVEFVAVFPDGRGLFTANTRSAERYGRLSRVETSDSWKSYGRPAWPMSTGKATAPGSALVSSSMIRPAPLYPQMPPQYHTFGTVQQQAASIFTQMQQQLSDAGLDFSDVFFLRTIVYPMPNQSIARSFGTFNGVYNTRFNNASNPNRPTRTVMSAPGFSHKRQAIAVEYFASHPDPEALTASVAESGTTSFGESPAFTSTESIAAGTHSIPPDRAVLWVSGAIASDPDAPLADQVEQAFATVEKRLQNAGAGLDDIVHLRAYLKTDSPPALEARLSEWETLFLAKFPADAPNRPALTTLPVVQLPGDSLIEIEVLAASDES